jgi:hypothetical protein
LIEFEKNPQWKDKINVAKFFRVGRSFSVKPDSGVEHLDESQLNTKLASGAPLDTTAATLDKISTPTPPESFGIFGPMPPIQTGFQLRYHHVAQSIKFSPTLTSKIIANHNNQQNARVASRLALVPS